MVVPTSSSASGIFALAPPSSQCGLAGPLMRLFHRRPTPSTSSSSSSPHRRNSTLKKQSPTYTAIECDVEVTTTTRSNRVYHSALPGEAFNLPPPPPYSVAVGDAGSTPVAIDEEDGQPANETPEEKGERLKREKEEREKREKREKAARREAERWKRMQVLL